MITIGKLLRGQQFKESLSDYHALPLEKGKWGIWPGSQPQEEEATFCYRFWLLDFYFDVGS